MWLLLRNNNLSMLRLSKVGESPTDPLEQRVKALERSLSTQEAFAGELSEQLDNVVQKNEEVTRVAKDMITELGRALREELRALANEVIQVREIA
ncbi:hypothetical protein JCGZ_01166 [Jatropha curcas]|uniref:Uncharacterized protein n=1 Tax=Jatropha curcas TaxID=180498 RepID=A0A067JGL2_JATCU|nr:hypothetical protein JCGZ_01166 [Jatropha curcas]